MTFEPWIDAHLHFARLDRIDSLLTAMDATNAQAAVIFGLQHSPDHTEHDDAVYAAAQQVPERLWPALCGFNPIDPAAPAYVARRLAQGGWCAIGEYLVGHRAGRRAYGPEVHWRHPMVDAVLSLAAEASLPVLAHCDPIWQDELVDAMAAHPRTTFVWVHVAYEFTAAEDHGPRQPGWAGELLDRFPNLCFDLSTFTESPAFYAEASWQALFERHADRFVLGLDTTGDYAHQMGERRGLFATALAGLDTETRRGIVLNNARRLFNATPPTTRRAPS